MRAKRFFTIMLFVVLGTISTQTLLRAQNDTSIPTKPRLTLVALLERAFAYYTLKNMYVSHLQHPLHVDGIPEYYSLYCDSSLWDSVIYDDILRSIRGVQRIEELFDVKHGMLVRGIHITNEEISFFRPLERFCIHLSIKGQWFEKQRTAEHETIHLIDYHFSLSEESLWQKTFKRLQEEKYFFPYLLLDASCAFDYHFVEMEAMDFGFCYNLEETDLSFDGENPEQFFAMFVTSLTRYYWEQFMSHHKKIYVDNYKMALIALQIIVEEREELEGTILDLLIEKRLSWFEETNK